MEDLSSTVQGGLTGGSSMCAANMTSMRPPFQPEGSQSEGSDGVTPGWPAFGSPGPHGTGPDDASPRYIAGMGDRGGVLHGDGQAPGDGFGWQSVNDRASVTRWSTAVDP